MKFKGGGLIFFQVGNKIGDRVIKRSDSANELNFLFDLIVISCYKGTYYVMNN